MGESEKAIKALKTALRNAASRNKKRIPSIESDLNRAQKGMVKTKKAEQIGIIIKGDINAPPNNGGFFAKIFGKKKNICSSCGAEVKEGQLFCNKCGSELK